MNRKFINTVALPLLAFALLACSKVSTQVNEALGALGKLDASTQVGVSRSEYSRLLIEAQAKINDATEILPEGDLRKELTLAMRSYNDAQTIWDRKGTRIADLQKEASLLSGHDLKEFDTDKWIAACTGPPPASKNDLENFYLKQWCDETIDRLVNMYKITLRDGNGDSTSSSVGRISRQEALDAIWASGREHLPKAKAAQ